MNDVRERLLKALIELDRDPGWYLGPYYSGSDRRKHSLSCAEFELWKYIQDSPAGPVPRDHDSPEIASLRHLVEVAAGWWAHDPSNADTLQFVDLPEWQSRFTFWEKAMSLAEEIENLCTDLLLATWVDGWEYEVWDYIHPRVDLPRNAVPPASEPYEAVLARLQRVADISKNVNGWVTGWDHGWFFLPMKQWQELLRGRRSL